jgi:hypothetical protein
MPANERSVNIMDSTGNNMNLKGHEVRYDSWYGYTDGFGTMMVTYDNFVGKFVIEATLSLEPTEADWFGVIPTNAGNVSYDDDRVYPDLPAFFVNQEIDSALIEEDPDNSSMVPFPDYFITEGWTPGENNNTWFPDGSVWITLPYTATVGYNIQGNFTYVRCRMDRTAVSEDQTYDPSYGQITRVILST